VLAVDQERTGEAVQHLGDAAEALYVPAQNAGIERGAGDVIELRARLGAHYLAPCCCRIVGVVVTWVTWELVHGRSSSVN
jgi:hypothetical protein